MKYIKRYLFTTVALLIMGLLYIWGWLENSLEDRPRYYYQELEEDNEAMENP